MYRERARELALQLKARVTAEGHGQTAPRESSGKGIYASSLPGFDCLAFGIALNCLFT